MKGITVGQLLGIHPMYSTLPTRYQYKSRNDGKWKNCTSKYDMECYQKYEYETRILFN